MTKKIVVFDPSVGTHNQGDLIIREAIDSELEPIFNSGFVVRYSTHTPVLHGFQTAFPTPDRDFCETADFKFLGGTNLIKTNLAGRKPGWNINLITASLYRNSIAVGCGVGGEGGIQNAYTKDIYHRVLSRDYVHSARDERTAEILRSLGVRAVNTGCPTMWALTPEHCALIPQERARSVVFTVTDYARDSKRDLEILRVLRDNYEKTYVWVQGSRDYEYLAELGILRHVSLIPPNVDAYRSVLIETDVDYVGTRLHAGLFAMRNMRRAIIVAVDHRALDIHEEFNINVVERGDIASLERGITGRIVTEVKSVPQVVTAWKEQFFSG